MSPANHSGPLRLPAGTGSISVDRGLAILELFKQRGTLGVKDAANTLGIPRSTVHRYLVTLLELGWLLHDTGVAPQITPVQLESHIGEIRFAAERLGVAMSAAPRLAWSRGR